MSYLGVLGLLQVLQNGTCSDDSRLQMIHTKTLQVLHLKVIQQFLLGSLVGKHPVVQLEGEVFSTKVALKLLFLITIEEYLLWREVA